MRVRPPLSVRFSWAAVFPGTSSVKLSNSCSATYLLLTVVRRPPPLEVDGSCPRQSAAEEGGVPLVPERHGHVPLLRPGGDPCFVEHDGKAPLLGQHAGDEVLLVGTGRQPPALSERVPEKPVRRDEAIAQVWGGEPEGGVRRVLVESAVPHRHVSEIKPQSIPCTSF